MRCTTYFLLILFFTQIGHAQDACNAFGAWIWYPEITIFNDHNTIADRLSNLGVKRIYLKVSDGMTDTIKWPEMVDKSIPKIYHEHGLQVWGWSYNYRGNEFSQAQALRYAADSGYDGYVVDVEMEFDGKPEALQSLFYAFRSTLDQAQVDGIIDESFKMYCTTWGNPLDHNYSIAAINPFVDGFMPQTYVEIWGQPFIDDLTYWINEGNEEYEALGATKPIHHICATELGVITSAKVTEFFHASGPESSLWVLPGSNTNPDIWGVWKEVDWNINFCPTSTEDVSQQSKSQTIIYSEPFQLPYNGKTSIFSLSGEIYSIHNNMIDLTTFPSGMYFIKNWNTGQVLKIIKMT